MRSHYCPRLWLWRVRLDTGDALDHRSPMVHVVAPGPQAAATEALDVMREAGHPDVLNLHVLEILAVNVVNGVAAPSPRETTANSSSKEG